MSTCKRQGHTTTIMQCCLSYAGDEHDNNIRRATNHHPNCKLSPFKPASYEQKRQLSVMITALESTFLIQSHNLLPLAQMVLHMNELVLWNVRRPTDSEEIGIQ